ncbi:hypothetical protein PVAP13_3KG485965 [Panicum virgatum]|uniref:Uncharacterized protein n=1 Tax=Panicum virgatum TaxID=38727 RepID=A0A8T0V229_PANVG|nr:hypothetical protein PVAP13_3KG485965 [Panicum virgatum]
MPASRSSRGSASRACGAQRECAACRVGEPSRGARGGRLGERASSWTVAAARTAGFLATARAETAGARRVVSAPALALRGRGGPPLPPRASPSTTLAGSSASARCAISASSRRAISASIRRRWSHRGRLPLPVHRRGWGGGGGVEAVGRMWRGGGLLDSTLPLGRPPRAPPGMHVPRHCWRSAPPSFANFLGMQFNSAHYTSRLCTVCLSTFVSEYIFCKELFIWNCTFI